MFRSSQTHDEIAQLRGQITDLQYQVRALEQWRDEYAKDRERTKLRHTLTESGCTDVEMALDLSESPLAQSMLASDRYFCRNRTMNDVLNKCYPSLFKKGDGQ
jgi:hypothetical protein